MQLVGMGTPPPHAPTSRRLRRLDLRAFGAQTRRSQNSFLGNDALGRRRGNDFSVGGAKILVKNNQDNQIHNITLCHVKGGAE